MSKHDEIRGMQAGRSDEFREWVGAYLDGELSVDQRKRMDAHLKTCAACREELSELRALSSLLHFDSMPMSTTRADVFSQQVVSRLSQHHSFWMNRMEGSKFKLAPLAIFSIWAFCQAVLWVSGGLFLALRFIPSADNVIALLLPFVNFAANDSGNPAPGILGLSSIWSAVDSLFQATPLLGPLTLLNVVSLVLFSVLFLAWLGSFWQRNQTVKVED